MSEAASSPKLNVKSTASPSEDIVKATEAVATDPLGRKWTLREPDVLQEFKFVEVVGADRAANNVWMQMAMPIGYIRGVQDPGEAFEEIPFPRSMMDIESIISRLGTAGYKAVAIQVAQSFNAAPADMPAILAKAKN